MPTRCRHNMARRSRMQIVSVSKCVIYILPLLWSSKYDAVVVSCCDKQCFNVLIFFWWPIRGWGGLVPLTSY